MVPGVALSGPYVPPAPVNDSSYRNELVSLSVMSVAMSEEVFLGIVTFTVVLDWLPELAPPRLLRRQSRRTRAVQAQRARK